MYIICVHLAVLKCNVYVYMCSPLCSRLICMYIDADTVDYWSLGLTVFEVITGKRPFLYNLPPIQVHTFISQKRKEHICAYQNAKGDAVLSEKICFTNHLPKRIQPLVEKWLSLMLDISPQTRGGGFNSGGRQKCYELLTSIVNTRIVRLHSLVANTVFEYEVGADTTVAQLQTLIARDTGISVEEQELLLSNGTPPDINKPASLLCTTVNEDRTLFLLSTSFSAVHLHTSLNIPDHLSAMMNNPHQLLKFHEAKRCLADGVLFCQDRIDNYTALRQGESAAMNDLLNSSFLQLLRDLVDHKASLHPVLDFFQTSAQTDIMFCREIYPDISFLSIWEKNLQKVQGFRSLLDRVSDLAKRATLLQNHIQGLQKMQPCWDKNLTELKTLKSNATDLYDRLQNIPKEQRNMERVATHNMVRLVTLCISQWKVFTTNILKHFSQVATCKKTIKDLTQHLQAALHDVDCANQLIKQYQGARQKQIWNIHIIDDDKKLRISDVNKNFQFVNGVSEMLPVTNGEMHSDADVSDRLSSSPSAHALDTFFEQSSMEMQKTLINNESAHTELEKLFVHLQVNKDRAEKCDWKFLPKNK